MVWNVVPLGQAGKSLWMRQWNPTAILSNKEMTTHRLYCSCSVLQRVLWSYWNKSSCTYCDIWPLSHSSWNGRHCLLVMSCTEKRVLKSHLLDSCLIEQTMIKIQCFHTHVSLPLFLPGLCHIPNFEHTSRTFPPTYTHKLFLFCFPIITGLPSTHSLLLLLRVMNICVCGRFL